MALIKCPECGQPVSNKAEICPHCGIKIAGNVDISPQDAMDETRPSMTQHPQETPTEPDTNGNGKKSTKLIAVSFVIALAICGAGYYLYTNAQEEKEMEAYINAMQSDNPVVMRTYLTQYAYAPQEHRDSVNARFSLLENEDKDWRNAVVSGTKSALQEYIDKHPSSPHRGEALNKIDSIDFSIASRQNNIAAYKNYLQQHEDGRYAAQAQEFINEKTQTEVSQAETVMAKTIFRQFFQAINSRNESKLVETVASVLDNFLNKPAATSSDVVTFMNKLYKDDVKNLNWHILDDFKVEKVKKEDNTVNMQVQFGAQLQLERTDPTKEKQKNYIITGEITPEGKITKLNMRVIGG